MDSNLDSITRFKSFFSWWKNELAEMLPSFLSLSEFPSDNLLLILFDKHDEILFYSRIENQWKQLGQCHSNSAFAEVDDIVSTALKTKPTVILRLSDSIGLKRNVVLPMAAERDIDAVLFHQLDSLSPYPVNLVYYSSQIDKRDFKTERVHVNLYIAPRDQVDDIVEKFSLWKIDTDIVDLITDDKLALPTSTLLPKTPSRNNNTGKLSRTTRILLIINLLLLSVLVVSQPLLQYRQIGQLESRLETARLKADVAVKLRKKVDDMQKQSGFLHEMKQASIPVLTTLNELSSILPDGTWLEQVSVDGMELTFSGNSSKAAPLISTIEKSTFFEDAAFKDAVIFDNQINAEHFKIGTRILRRQ